MRTLDNINKFLVEKLGQKAQPTLLDAFNALSRAYGGEGKARSKEKALEELAIVFVGPGAPGITLAKPQVYVYNSAFMKSIATADIRGLDTSKVTDMSSMFSGCGVEGGIRSLDLSNFNTSQVTTMHYMFSGMFITSIDISSFDTKNVSDTLNAVFDNCLNLTSVKFPGEGKWASNARINTFNISTAPLDVDSIRGLVTALATKTSQCTLKLKSANWEAAKAADSTLETALSAKNWVVTAV